MSRSRKPKRGQRFVLEPAVVRDEAGKLEVTQ